MGVTNIGYYYSHNDDKHDNKPHVGKTITNHPQFHHVYRWHKSFPNGWLIIVVPTLLNATTWVYLKIRVLSGK